MARTCILILSQLPGEYTNQAACLLGTRRFFLPITIMTSRVPIYTAGWTEALMFEQGHNNNFMESINYGDHPFNYIC